MVLMYKITQVIFQFSNSILHELPTEFQTLFWGILETLQPDNAIWSATSIQCITSEIIESISFMQYFSSILGTAFIAKYTYHQSSIKEGLENRAFSCHSCNQKSVLISKWYSDFLEKIV